MLAKVFSYAPYIILGALIWYYHRKRTITRDDTIHVEEHPEETLGEQPGINEEPEDEEGEEEEEEVIVIEQDNEPRAENSRRQRTVGAKKSKSLARKDRIRAYNEFVRQRAQEQRQVDLEFQQKFGDLIDQERKERDTREQLAKQEIQNRLQDKRQQELKSKRLLNDAIVSLTQQLTVNHRVRITNELERQAAEHLIFASRHQLYFLVSNGEWIIKLKQEQLSLLCTEISKNGRQSFLQLADVLSLSTLKP
jgi:hypothetical protein